MKGKRMRMSALATASLMAMTALVAMPQPAMADEEKTVINIWSKDRHDADYVQKKVDEYNENNTDNIEVNYQLYTDNYTQAVDMAVQSGEMPDILVFQDEMFDKYIGEDQWADLYEFMDDDMKEMFKDIMSLTESFILFRQQELHVVCSTTKKSLTGLESKIHRKHLRRWLRMRN